MNNNNLTQIFEISRFLLLQREAIEATPESRKPFLEGKGKGHTEPLLFNAYMIEKMAFLMEELDISQEAPDYAYIRQLLEKHKKIVADREYDREHPMESYIKHMVLLGDLKYDLKTLKEKSTSFEANGGDWVYDTILLDFVDQEDFVKHFSFLWGKTVNIKYVLEMSLFKNNDAEPHIEQDKSDNVIINNTAYVYEKQIYCVES